MNITDGQLEGINIEMYRFGWTAALFTAIKHCNQSCDVNALCDLGKYISDEGHNMPDYIIDEVKC
jgi:hypothetical protein